MNRNVIIDNSSNITYDFKELNVVCYIDDVSYESFTVLDFIDIDVSGNLSISPEFANLNRVDLSFTSLSEGVLYIPIDHFQDLFKFNIRKNEILNDDFDHINFAIDTNNWKKNNYSIPFSKTFIFQHLAVNPRSKIANQTIENDYIRSIVKDITGNLKFTSIFNNLNDLKQNMTLLDNEINTKITNILNFIGGSTTEPYTHNDLSNNPVRDFIVGILETDDFKLYRKHKLLDDLSEQINKVYDENIMTKFYITGLSYKGYGTYYPVYVNKTHPDLYIGYKTIKFPQYKDKFFYVNPIALNVDSDTNNIPENIKDYDKLIDKVFINVPFIYGDTLKMKITYKPKNRTFSNRTINDRSYQINLIMTLESEKIVDFTDISYVDASKIGNQGHELTYNESGIGYMDISGNFDFELLWLGSLDKTNEFFSHYHYYPFLYNLSNIHINLKINEFDNLFCIKILFRPRQHQQDHIKLIIKPASIVYNSWKMYNINDFVVLLNNDILYNDIDTFKNETLINIKKDTLSNFFTKETFNEISNYNTYLYLNEGQQILSINLQSNVNNSINCKMNDFMLEFNDNHIIKIKLK